MQERKNDLYLHHFVLITNATPESWSARDLVDEYRKRGTMETRLGELQSVLAPALSCTLRREHRTQEDQADVPFRNGATMVLFALAYNLAHSTRLTYARATHHPCGLDRLRKRVLAVPAVVLVSARRATVAVAVGVAAVWQRILDALPVPNLA